MIAAAVLLVVAAVAFAEATGTPAYQLLVAVVGVPLWCLWLVRALVRMSQPAPVYSPAPRTVRGQIVVTRVAEPVYRIPALPYGAARRIEGGRTEETA